MTGKERILAMIEGRPVDCLPLMPITMMFAADRAGVKYGQYVADHRVLVQAQIHVAEEFDYDFVSVISDPAREVADLGGSVEWFDDQPPAIDARASILVDKKALARLQFPDPLGGGRMHDRVLGAALFKERVRGEKLIEGWVEGPCAMGADLRGINTLMTDFLDDPTFVRDLFEFSVEMELRFARAQVEAGAEIIGVGDAAASLIGPALYYDFVEAYEKRLIEGIHASGALARLHICGRTRRIFDGMGRVGADIVDLDWPAPMAEARAHMGPDQVLLGNIDPVSVFRNGTPEQVRESVAACHRDAGSRYIVSAGCETVRDTPIENMRAMCDYARAAR